MRFMCAAAAAASAYQPKNLLPFLYSSLSFPSFPRTVSWFEFSVFNRRRKRKQKRKRRRHSATSLQPTTTLAFSFSLVDAADVSPPEKTESGSRRGGHGRAAIYWPLIASSGWLYHVGLLGRITTRRAQTAHIHTERLVHYQSVWKRINAGRLLSNW